MADLVPPWYRQLCGFGVTGTNGKTSTALFLNAMLAEAGPTAAVTTVGLFAQTERLPYELSAQGMVRALEELSTEGGRNCVLELSSEVLALGFLHKYPVRYGTFTNLSHDHLDAHVSPEHYLASKAQLFMSLPKGGAAVLNAADSASTLLNEVIPPGVTIVRYGLASRGEVPANTEWRASRVSVGVDGTQLELEPNRWMPTAHLLRTTAVGEVFAENALAAFATAVVAGIDPARATAALARLPAPPGRFEVLARSPLVVLDYAHTPDALRRTLASTRAICSGRVIIVFGAGGERDKDKRHLMGAAAQSADIIWLTSDNPRSEDPGVIADAIEVGIGEHAAVYRQLERRSAIREALAAAGPADCVIVAGKGHETVQEVAGRRLRLSDRDIVLGLLRG